MGVVSMLLLLAAGVATSTGIELSCGDAASPPPTAALYLSWSVHAITENQVRKGSFTDAGGVYEHGVVCDPILFFLQDDLNADLLTTAVFLNDSQAKLDSHWPQDIANLTMVNVSLLQKHAELSADVVGLQQHSGLLSLALRGGVISDIPLGFLDGFSELLILDLSGNNITHLQSHVFRHLRSLIAFMFSDNHLVHYDVDLLCNLPVLHSITMNNVFMDGMPRLFTRAATRPAGCDQYDTYHKTRILRLSRNNFPVLFNSSFDGLDDLNNELQIAGSHVTRVEAGAFVGLRHVKYFFLSDNAFMELPVTALHPITDLLQLIASGGRLREISAEHFQSNSKIRSIDLARNDIQNLRGTFSSVKKLRQIFLTRNNLSLITNDTFAGSSLLNELHLAFNQLTNIGEGTFHGLGDDLKVNISNNRISDLDPDMFLGMDQLLSLDMSHNYVTELPQGIFSGQESLRTLDLSSNRLWTLHANIFYRSTQLTSLDVSNNELNSFEEALLFGVQALTVLRMAGNNITYLNANTLISRSRSLQEVTLADNPWHCACALEALVPWMRDNTHVLTDVDTVTCHTPPPLSERRLVSLSMRELCGDDVTPSPLTHKQDTSVTTIATLSVTVVLLVVLVPTIIHFRREIQVLVYVKLGIRVCAGRAVHSDKRYDAFVSFSERDVDFVRNEMIPKLENEADPPFKLCVHYRDFEIGVTITENITSAIENSQRTVVLLSRHFLLSDWCKYEFSHAHHSGIDGSSSGEPIVVLMDNTKPADIKDRQLRSYLTTHTYLERSDQHFWKRLLYALPQHTVNESAGYISMWGLV